MSCQLASSFSGGVAVVPASTRLKRRPAVLRTYADHRLVHFAALLALRAPGTAVDDLQCVSKTMPRFPEDWARLVG